MSDSFVSVTESPGQMATAEQLSMLKTRYYLAGRYAEGKDVLEVACGTGIGLGYLASLARTVTGGDIDVANLAVARKTYVAHSVINLKKMDALRLPLRDSSMDVIILFEAIYYLSDAAVFFREARRILRRRGVLIISTVNSEWHGFHPSPQSTAYLTHSELVDTLMNEDFNVRTWFAFRDDLRGVRARVTAIIRRFASTLDAIPRTMTRKKWLKRVFYGRLSPFPDQVNICGEGVEPLLKVDVAELSHYKVNYVVATKRSMAIKN